MDERSDMCQQHDGIFRPLSLPRLLGRPDVARGIESVGTAKCQLSSENGAR